MAITQAICDSFKTQLEKGVHDFVVLTGTNTVASVGAAGSTRMDLTERRLLSIQALLLMAAQMPMQGMYSICLGLLQRETMAPISAMLLVPPQLN